MWILKNDYRFFLLDPNFGDTDSIIFLLPNHDAMVLSE